MLSLFSENMSKKQLIFFFFLEQRWKKPPAFFPQRPWRGCNRWDKSWPPQHPYRQNEIILCRFLGAVWGARWCQDILLSLREGPSLTVHAGPLTRCSFRCMFRSPGETNTVSKCLQNHLIAGISALFFINKENKSLWSWRWRLTRLARSFLGGTGSFSCVPSQHSSNHARHQTVALARLWK